MIEKHWNLKGDNGITFTGDTVKAAFTVTLLDPGTATHNFTLHLGQGLLDLNYFTVAYAWDVDVFATPPYGAMAFCIQSAVVNPLIMPPESGGGHLNPYYSTFNEYTWSGNLNGDPGYIWSSGLREDALLNNLVQFGTQNFYWNGHGNPRAITDGKPESPNKVYISLDEICNITHLNNNWDPDNGSWCHHPYRFVFLDACDTADDSKWAHAFGIIDRITSTELENNPLAVQAFIGWNGSRRAAMSNDEWNTTYDSPGRHNLQAQLLYTGRRWHTVEFKGPILPFYSSNICQFNPFYSRYDSSGAILYAKVPQTNVVYSIELLAPSGKHIKTITGSTVNAEIEVHWDLTDEQGNKFTNDTVDAVFHVTLPGGTAARNSTLRIHGH